mmetsp:Transcript_12116/g.16738  ORF Transcript_12116/g.16738 Transcript_12116/m.16738 type:complete len:160 (-) Transcript_12116:123-602(-)
MSESSADASKFIEDIRAFAHNDSFANLLKFQYDEVGEGSCKMHIKVEPAHLSFNKVLHGGVLSSVCDACMGMACWELFYQGLRVSTIEFKINYYKPVQLGETIFCESQILHKGRSHVIIGCTVTAGEKRVAQSIGTYNIWRKKGKSDEADPLSSLTAKM